MNQLFSFSFLSRSLNQTGELANEVAKVLKVGDALLIDGELGVGKSVFSRELIRSCLSTSDKNLDIPSPSYTLIQTYPGKDFEIWHVDLYRLRTEMELVELGLEEAFSSALCIVEWGSKLEYLEPEDCLRMQINYLPEKLTQRNVTLQTTNKRLGLAMEQVLMLKQNEQG